MAEWIECENCGEEGICKSVMGMLLCNDCRNGYDNYNDDIKEDIKEDERLLKGV